VTERELRAVFDAPRPLTVGLEEEVMLVDARTFELAPVARAVLDGASGALKLELPASQAEIVTTPVDRVGEAIEQLRRGREQLAALAAPRWRVIAAGVHPTAAPLGELNEGERYDVILDAHGDAARVQLVCALQIHVALGDADATLAVYNALRGFLPELAALAANAPFHAGRDSGFASVRPLISTMLPRQGVPPVIPSWAEFAEMLRWTGDPKSWWYELRPHVGFGTLELRVCDTQTTLADAAAVAAFAHALIAWLHERAGELGTPDSWRIAENRWRTARHGLDAELADLVSGEPRPARELLRERLATLVPVAERIGCAGELEGAHALIECNGALRQRAAGLENVSAWLADRFLDRPPRRSAP